MCNHPLIREKHPKGMDMLRALRSPQELEKALVPLWETLDIQADINGIRNGWFCWPYKFDPCWLRKCNGFTEKETEKNGKSD